ncbi:Histone chaperone asf1 [Podila minutissima]|nr:Histone chaperone asf1 [Podila minutissima]
MSIVSITHIAVLDNPTHFANPYQFEITFECIAPLKADLEWKIIYVGSANSESHDQTLESIMVGPVPVGVNKFVFQADAPKPELIPHGDIVGVTVILITCSYQDREFVRIGYYVNNDYLDEELRENPPESIAYDKLYRSILAEKPRVTRFPINWDNPTEEEMPPLQTEEQVQEMEAVNKAQMLSGGDWEDMEA